LIYRDAKSKEPTKHQYDFDPGVPGCINFIRSNGLEGHIKLTIETNHATLAGHTVGHTCGTG
jgi:xylose isomerase